MSADVALLDLRLRRRSAALAYGLRADQLRHGAVFTGACLLILTGRYVTVTGNALGKAIVVTKPWAGLAEQRRRLPDVLGFCHCRHRSALLPGRHAARAAGPG